MKTKDKILHLLKKHDSASAGVLAQKLGMSRQMVHRHLRELVKKRVLAKKGSTPRVEYFALSGESRIAESIRVFEKLAERFAKRKKLGKFWQVPDSHTIDLHFLLQSSALYSSKIEGNTLDLNSFFNKAEIPSSKKKDLQEILDLQSAYEFAREHALNEENLLKAHKLLSRKLLSAGNCGKYRRDKVGVFGARGLEYMALEAKFVQSEMSALFAEITKLLERVLDEKQVFAWAMYLHIMLALIHPFADGNGRVARLAEKWFLAQKLGKGFWYIESEKFYFENLQKYYKSLSLGVNYWEVNFEKMRNFIDLHVVE